MNTHTLAESPDVQLSTLEIDPSVEADYLDLLDYERAVDQGGAL